VPQGSKKNCKADRGPSGLPQAGPQPGRRAGKSRKFKGFWCGACAVRPEFVDLLRKTAIFCLQHPTKLCRKPV